MENHKYGKRSLSYLNNKKLHPSIKVFMVQVLRETKYDISVIRGASTAEEQKDLYILGKTMLDGENNLSDHQPIKFADNKGRAIDFMPYMPDLALDIWDVNNHVVANIWCECFRAILRVDRLWKNKGIDVGLELGWTYNINGGRDYPHIGFTKL